MKNQTDKPEKRRGYNYLRIGELELGSDYIIIGELASIAVRLLSNIEVMKAIDTYKSKKSLGALGMN